MGTTPIKSTAFLQGLQRGNKGYTSQRAKADVRALAKTNPLAKRMLYGGELSQRQMVRMGKELQKDTHAFTQRSARTIYNKLTREAVAKERLEQLEQTKGAQAETALLQKKEDDANRKQAAYVRAKELEAEGKAASLKNRPNAAVSVEQTQSATAKVSVDQSAEPPPAIDMAID
ncbi:hypothetical protein HY625_02310 [Candidatus Uhrbacteria bacterium]|nr:hypothetical protein [Candidatus Uhrbacteria bacterium]